MDYSAQIDQAIDLMKEGITFGYAILFFIVLMCGISLFIAIKH